MIINQCKKSAPIKKYIRHTHTGGEIVYQLEGEALTHVGDMTVTLKKGDVLCIPANMPHSGEAEQNFCDFSLWSDDIDISKPTVLHDNSGDILTILLMLQRIITERQGDYIPLSETLADAAMKMIRHEIGISSSPSVEQIKREIYKNISNPYFELSKSIAKTGFDKDHFRRCFKSSTGMTPAQYLTELRITRAKQLLTDSKAFSISSIAESCGFSDNLYFSSCFKKHVGLSPREYRKSKMKL